LTTIRQRTELYVQSALVTLPLLCSAYNHLQSAYRPFHSTETALLLTLNSIYTPADAGHATLLVSLDLCAAFDTTDHNLLTSRFQDSFGVAYLHGSVLSWLKSYLHKRSQSVRVGSSSYSVAIPSYRSASGLCIRSYTFYPRDAMLARVFATATCLSVRPSVCHTPVLCLAERKQDHEMYTV